MAAVFVRDAHGGNNGSGENVALTVEAGRVDRVLIAVEGVRSATDSPINWRPTANSTVGQQLLTQIGPTLVAGGTLRIRVKALINPTTGAGAGGAGQINVSNPSSAGYIYWVGLYEGAKQDINDLLRSQGADDIVTQTGTAPADPSLTVACNGGDPVICAVMQMTNSNFGAGGPVPAAPPSIIREAFTSSTTQPEWLNVSELEADASSETVGWLYTGTLAWGAVAFAIAPAFASWSQAIVVG